MEQIEIAHIVWLLDFLRIDIDDDYSHRSPRKWEESWKIFSRAKELHLILVFQLIIHLKLSWHLIYASDEAYERTLAIIHMINNSQWMVKLLYIVENYEVLRCSA